MSPFRQKGTREEEVFSPERIAQRAEVAKTQKEAKLQKQVEKEWKAIREDIRQEAERGKFSLGWDVENKKLAKMLTAYARQQGWYVKCGHVYNGWHIYIYWDTWHRQTLPLLKRIGLGLGSIILILGSFTLWWLFSRFLIGLFPPNIPAAFGYGYGLGLIFLVWGSFIIWWVCSLYLIRAQFILIRRNFRMWRKKAR